MNHRPARIPKAPRPSRRIPYGIKTTMQLMGWPRLHQFRSCQKTPMAKTNPSSVSEPLSSPH